MADSSLDDFFAKKDKSKKKSKKSAQLGDGDDVSKSGEKKVKKKKDRDPNSANSQGSGQPNQNEDDEWKDFEEEKEVDYTGLRIQNMQIAKEDQDRDQADAEDEEYDEDGEVREKKDGASGPWNKSNEPAQSRPAPVAAVPEPVKEEPPAPKAAGKYIPPSMRNQQASSPAAAQFPSRRKKEAPNLHSEEDFPTLGGGPTPGKFGQYSNSSDLIENPSRGKGGNLTLENKFSALQD